MSRYRVKNMPAYGVMPWRYGTFPGSERYQDNADLSPYRDNVCEVFYRNTEVMLDNRVSTLIPSLWNWKDCEHLKTRAGGSQEAAFTFSPPTPTLYIRPELWYTPHVPSIPVQNWNPLVDDLATQLERGSSSSFNLLVSLAEMKQTFKMMKNPLAVLKSGFRNNPIGKAGAKLKTLSSIWLTGRYGWTPFLSDVSNLSQTLAKNMYTTIPRVEQRFSVRSRTDSQSTIVYSEGTPKTLWDRFESLPPCDWFNSLGGFTRYKNWTQSTSLVLSCVATDPALKMKNLLDRMLTSTGATPSWRNIRDVIWEVLPFSFVIDWFIDFSNAWRPLNDLSILQRTSDRVGYSVKSTVTCNPEFLFCKPLPTWYSGTLWSGLNPTNVDPVIREFPASSSSRYQRSTGLPASTTEILKSKGLSLFHCIDGVSLILQKAILH